LYSNSGYHLLVAEGQEKFSNDFGFLGTKLMENDYSAHQKCNPGSDDEREQSLEMLGGSEVWQEIRLTPAPATPASVLATAGTIEQFRPPMIIEYCY
jgi:hypothetical protein